MNRHFIEEASKIAKKKKKTPFSFHIKEMTHNITHQNG